MFAFGSPPDIIESHVLTASTAASRASYEERYLAVSASSGEHPGGVSLVHRGLGFGQLALCHGASGSSGCASHRAKNVLESLSILYNRFFMLTILRG